MQTRKNVKIVVVQRYKLIDLEGNIRLYIHHKSKLIGNQLGSLY